MAAQFHAGGVMNQNLLRAAFLGTASVFALTAPAQALVMTDTEFFNIFHSSTTLGETTDTWTLTFDEFDSSLGTLTGVQFELTSSGFVSGELNGSDTEGSGVVQVEGSIAGTLEMDVTVLGGVQLTSSALSDFQWCEQTVDPGDDASCSIGLYDNTSFGATFVVLEPDYFLFEGLGTFDVDMDAAMTLACQENTLNDVCSFNFGFLDWNGNVELTYTYDPPPVEVPEPATLALFGVGLFGMAVLHPRRRRRGGAPPNGAET